MFDNARAQALDDEILQVIAAWHRHNRTLSEPEFNDLALRIFAYQLECNEPYARYCASLGVTLRAMPEDWQAIPAVPTGAYKEATLATFDPSRAALRFTTSGTTRGTGGRHYMETRELYEAASLAAFDRFALPDNPRLRYLNLVPNPNDRADSSLGYMMAHVSAQRGDGETGWYVRGDDLSFDAFVADVRAAIDMATPVFIATTAFALAKVLARCEERALRFTLPRDSRIMETGGFKGRTRAVAREELYAHAQRCFGVAGSAMFAEYGMTELTSQYYDSIASRSQQVRVKVAPPWLRPRVVGPDGKTVPRGIVGALAHVDLANRSSCVAILTEDLGAEVDNGIVLLGREHGAAMRGCSLDAEELRTAARG